MARTTRKLIVGSRRTFLTLKGNREKALECSRKLWRARLRGVKIPPFSVRHYGNTVEVVVQGSFPMEELLKILKEEERLASFREKYSSLMVRILLAVREFCFRSPYEVASHLKEDTPVVKAILEDMERKGLIERVPIARSLTYRITEKGIEKLRRAGLLR